jgi:amino-acid N-acetyltransferase
MIEKARISDPPEMLAIINRYATQQLMLARSLNDIYDTLRDFFVCREDGRVLGVVALHIGWQGLGEVRSLAVLKEAQGRGIGRRLVETCLEEARQLGMKRVFVLTRLPQFFEKLGFVQCPKESLPHKVWADCLNCPRFPDCDEVALIKDLESEA